MVVVLGGMDAEASDEQYLKASFPMLVTAVPERSTDVRTQ